ncbi:hypothetical protein [Acinetobacter seifertii]|uniref:hypothetical protein n=1 Tax=Acinetobacter seifertii TaxID=1530123 RepID=UPI003862392C
MILFLAVINFIFCAFCAYRGYRNSSLTFLFWSGNLFFFGIPNLIDSLAISLDYAHQLENYLYIQDQNFDFNFQITKMREMITFVFLFNVLFYLGEKISGSNFKKINITNAGQFEYLLLFLNFIFLGLFMVNYPGEWFVADFYRQTNFMYQLSVLIICICTSVSFNFALNGKKILALLNLVPTILVSFITSERPYLAPALGILFLWMVSLGKNTLVNLFKIIGVGIFAIFLMRFVRFYANKQDFDLLGIIFSRDSATSVLYYIFQTPDYYAGLTNGKALVFLLSTGIIPSFLFDERNFASVDIPSILAFDKFGWTFGTIHPTLYGWFFVDSGWISLIFALFLGVIIGKLNNLTQRYSSRLYSIFVVAISLFIFVGLRGSLQVAYSKAFYVFVIGCLLMFFYNLLLKTYPKRKV